MQDLYKVLMKKDVSIGIFGLGKSNLGVLDYIRQQNPTFRLTVRSDSYVNFNSSEIERLFLGKDSLKEINEDILFLSPSVKRNRPEFSEALKKGCIISSDAEMFFGRTSISPICVTGSDGKSTTTRLISDTLCLSGISAVPCGNFGKSLSSLLGTDIFPVAELSSFQLNYLCPKSSRAVITNITPNHLNWHNSLEEYVFAKMNITKNAEKIIFDTDSEILKAQFEQSYVYAKTSLCKSYRELKSEGGCENCVTYENGIIYVNGTAFCNVSGAKKKEPYTLRNFLLTVGACLDLCGENVIEQALVSFSGLAHRADAFFRHNGIEYIDSSIDSSPERTIKTLSALGGKITVIIGGKGKGLSLLPLAERLPSLVENAVLLGEVGSELAKLLRANSSSLNFVTAENMRDAVIRAKECSAPGFKIVLSPAATSFDSYKNFEERGNDFKKCVFSSAN